MFRNQFIDVISKTGMIPLTDLRPMIANKDADIIAEIANPTYAELREMIMKSGMSFEWRLLAWHRAGRDPQALRDLLGNDLKGLLLTLSESIRKQSAKGRLSGRLRQAKQKALEEGQQPN